jgi:tryptophan halogenase
MKATLNGMKLPLEDFSLGVAAAKHRRFVADADESGFSHVAYGYHLSAYEYVNAIARAAIEVGVKRIDGQFKTVNRDNEKIVSVELQDGTVVEADFYIDASGPEAILISALSDNNFDNNFESWDHWFRCDRMITASSGPLSPTPAFSQITAFSSGWCGLYPLSNRTAIQALYSSRDTEFVKVVEEVKTSLGADISGGIERKIKCGMLKRAWIGNCLAIGSAAAVLEPLDALQQHSLVISMVMLKQLFPNSDEYGNETKIYNDKMYSFIANLRNFQLAHYTLNSRPEPFWVACRRVESPACWRKKWRCLRIAVTYQFVKMKHFRRKTGQVYSAVMDCRLSPIALL